MKRSGILLLALLLVAQISTLQAAWLNFEPQTIEQPDGTIINCYATGDEFYNWLHDENGFTIIKDHQTGYYVFADLQNDELITTNFIVGKVNPSDSGLQPWLNIPVEAMHKRRSDFLTHQMPVPEVIQGFDNPANRDNTGTFNNLVVYIRFSDQQEFTNDTTYYFNMFNNTSPGYSSMYNYFEAVSYETLFMPSHFYPVPPQNTVISYQDTYPRAYFMPYDPGTNTQGYQGDDERRTREHKLLKRAVEAIASEVPSDLNIDYNNDGYVDNVVFIIRGGTTAWSTLLWPHRWVLYSESAFINGKRVWDYNFQLETSLTGSGTGVLVHEMFHSLGAPDLYHYTTQPVTPVGAWDVMAQNNNPPQSMGAYMKFRYGHWIDDIPEITECGVYTLEPVASDQNNCYKIASPNSTTDYFVLEYRLKQGVFESTLPTSGLLIYRVDATMHGQGNAQGPPDELYVYRPNGTNYVNGTLPQAAFAEDFGRTAFNDNTNPACFLSNDLPGGIDIFNIGMIGETISFEVNFQKPPIANFSVSTQLITENCSVEFYDLSLCYVDAWEWTFEGGTPATSIEQNPSGIFYENEGTYDVTLKVTNQWGEHTVVFENLIEVSTSVLPVVNFTASDTLACTNKVIQFIDQSTLCPMAWNWEITPSSFEFVNGTSAASQHPEVIFNSPTTYSVKLTVENANGNSELSRQNYIQAGGANFVDFVGSFEEDSFAQQGWMVENPDNAITWSLWDVEGSGNGTKAAGINFYNYYAFNQRDRLISPPLAFNAESAAKLKFKHAYARVNLQFTDSLIVKISNDCGETWTRLLAVADDGTGNFVTRDPVGFAFIPATPEDWCGTDNGADCFEIDVTPWIGDLNVRIMFEAVCIIGNNLFIDDVHFDMATPISDHSAGLAQETLQLFPNPASNEVTVSYEAPAGKYLMNILDVNGRVILNENINADQTIIHQTFDLKGFSKGVYVVRISGDTFLETKKLVIR
ncbi:MAG: M6 family metalloprotease domain-containing protein [Bacteroidales bacterium]|nr:M6 family metalloprotease domain-containing protein [Bacteroidales bacterium]